MERSYSLCSSLKQTMSHFSFSKLENKRAEQVCLGGLVSMGGGVDGGRVWEGEYGANTVFTCM
jgi:hypothetical protein